MSNVGLAVLLRQGLSIDRETKLAVFLSDMLQRWSPMIEYAESDEMRRRNSIVRERKNKRIVGLKVVFWLAPAQARTPDADISAECGHVVSFNVRAIYFGNLIKIVATTNSTSIGYLLANQSISEAIPADTIPKCVDHENSRNQLRAEFDRVNFRSGGIAFSSTRQAQPVGYERRESRIPFAAKAKRANLRDIWRRLNPAELGEACSRLNQRPLFFAFRLKPTFEIHNRFSLPSICQREGHVLCPIRQNPTHVRATLNS